MSLNKVLQTLTLYSWNYGTEKKEGPIYHNGNDEPQGFGHIAVTVPDIEAACARFEELKVPFKKRLQDGKMHNIAFILGEDPREYRVPDADQECRPGWLLDRSCPAGHGVD